VILCPIRQKGNEAFSCVFLVFSLMKIGKANLRLKWKNKQIIGKEKLLKKWQKREYWKLHNKQIIGIGKMLKK